MLKLRRARHLVAYWTDEGMATRNFAAGTAVLSDPIVIYVLTLCRDWTPAAELRRRLRPVVKGSPDRLLRAMVERKLLIRSDCPQDANERAMDGWNGWNPAAGFFHASTRNTPVTRNRVAAERALQEAYARDGAPASIKRYPRAPTLTLPEPRAGGEFSDVLRGRRTWRKFSERPVTLAEIATLLGLTSGVQRTEMTVGLGPVHLKTSPSAGARQPLETYVLAVNVEGLAPGLYHYVPDGHALERIRKNATPGTIARYIPEQPWYRTAAALVILTAVFARTQWRYPYPQAYRSVLLEAGHVCQTFCLAATWLSLAPFCTALFADAVVERDLKIDGISESFIYGAGVGSRPPGLDWAPWPEETGAESDL